MTEIRALREAFQRVAGLEEVMVSGSAECNLSISPRSSSVDRNDTADLVCVRTQSRKIGLVIEA